MRWPFLALTLLVSAALLPCVTPIACNPGQYDAGGSCANCIQNCYTCSTATDCQACYSGYYLSDATNAASNTCTAYSTSGLCAQCSIDEFCAGDAIGCVSCYAINGACQQCSSSSDFNGICTTCQYGFTLDSSTNRCMCDTSPYSTDCTYCVQNTCKQASEVITNCDTQTATTCTKCSSGYYYASASAGCRSCSSSIPGCYQCTVLSTIVTCASNSCVSGYVYSSGTCIACSSFDINCIACSQTACTLCTVGYYYSTTSSICESCTTYGPKCVTCSSSACLTCSVTYYLTDSNTCRSCQAIDQQCVNCMLVGGVPQCQQCKNGYSPTPDALSCVQCTQTGCIVCTLTGASEPYTQSCDFCAIKYGLDAQNGVCRECVEIDLNCVLCEFDGTRKVCTLCDRGFAITPQGTCIACPENCLRCDALTGGGGGGGSSSTIPCIACQPGSSLNADGVCIDCSDAVTQHCDKCAFYGDVSVCVSCEDGYAINGQNTCEECAASLDGCVSCVYADGETITCTHCNSGYNLVDGQCEAYTCSPPCQAYQKCNRQTFECDPSAFGSRLSALSAILLAVSLWALIML